MATEPALSIVGKELRTQGTPRDAEIAEEIH